MSKSSLVKSSLCKLSRCLLPKSRVQDSVNLMMSKDALVVIYRFNEDDSQRLTHDDLLQMVGHGNRTSVGVS